MNHSQTKHRARGFTLIEMLVVALVIGILASLAVARYIKARDRSQVCAATYDLDLVRKLLAYYSVDWSTYPPSAASFEDLQDQLVDADGKPLGRLPYPYTFEFLSYGLDGKRDYVVRVKAMDNGGTILVATPEAISRE